MADQLVQDEKNITRLEDVVLDDPSILEDAPAQDPMDIEAQQDVDAIPTNQQHLIGAPTEAPPGAIERGLWDEKPNFTKMEDVAIVHESGIADLHPKVLTPPEALKQIVTPTERLIANVFLRGRPDAQKLFFENRGYKVSERDGETVLQKDNAIGGIETELFLSDLFSLEGLERVADEIGADFTDGIDEMLSAGAITAAQAANFSTLGPYGLLAVPFASAGAELAVEGLLQTVAQKAGIAEYDADAFKTAALVAAATSPIDMLIPGGPSANAKAALREGLKKQFPAAAAKSKVAKDAISQIMKKGLEATNVAGRYLGSLADKGDLLLTRSLIKSSKDIEKGAVRKLESIGAKGFFADLDLSDGAIVGSYKKLLETIGGVDIRSKTKGVLPDRLGARIGQLRQVLSSHHDGWSATDILESYRGALTEHLSDPTISAAEKSVFQNLWNQERKNVIGKIAKNGGKADIALLGKINTGYSKLVASFDDIDGDPFTSKFYHALAQSGRKLHNEAAGELAQSTNKSVAGISRNLLEANEYYSNLIEAEPIIRTAASKVLADTSSYGAGRVLGRATGAGNPGVTVSLGNLLTSSPETQLKRALAGAVVKGKFEAPLLSLAARNPVTIGAPTAVATALSPKLLTRNTSAFLQGKGIEGTLRERLFVQARTGVILENLRSAFGETRAKEIVEGVGEDGFQLSEEEAAIVSETVPQADQEAEMWTSTMEEVSDTSNPEEVGMALHLFSKRFPNLMEDAPLPGAVKVEGKWKLYGEDRVNYAQQIRLKSSLDKGQKARMISAVHKDGLVIDPPSKNTTRKESIAPKLDKKLNEDKPE